MERFRRWRWWGKWLTAFALGVGAVVWIVSGWWLAECAAVIDSKTAIDIEVRSGLATLRIIEALGARGRGIARPEVLGSIEQVRARGFEPPVWFWRWKFDHWDADRGPPIHISFAEIPIWILLLAFLLADVWLWRADRQHHLSKCRYCGYDVSAAPSGQCPECGCPALRACGNSSG
jgi:hypothetical protein